MATVPATSADPGSSRAREGSVRELEKVLGEKMPALIRQGREAFERDLPALLGAHAGEWVAYSGEQRLGFGGSKTALHAECLRRGLTPDQFLVLRVEPLVTHEADVPVDV